MLMGSKEMTQLQKKVKNRRKTKQNKKKTTKRCFLQNSRNNGNKNICILSHNF